MSQNLRKIFTIVLWVVEFSSGGYEIGKIFASNKTYLKEIIEF